MVALSSSGVLLSVAKRDEGGLNDDVLQGVDSGRFQAVMKQLGKRDTTTKLKVHHKITS